MGETETPGAASRAPTGSDGQFATDVVIVGSGGGLAGALEARAAGYEVLVIEKAEVLGGSTALSGGTWWAPATPPLTEAGVEDSLEQALAYLDAVVGDVGPSTSAERKRAYITGGQDLYRLLVDRGVELDYSDGWPDYYAESPGGIARGRAIHGRPYDGHRLGPVADWLRTTRLFLAANSVEVAPLALSKRSPRTARIAARVGIRSLLAKIRGQQLLTRGQSLVGQMLAACVRDGVQFWRGTECLDLLVEGDRVVGVVVEREGRRREVRARHGVLLAAGGFSHNTAMRKEHQPDSVGSGWSMAQPGDTGEVLQTAMRLGVATDLMDEAWWVPGTTPPEGVMLHVWDRCFPHTVMVDQTGLRYANEAAPYMDLGHAMIERDRAVPAVPSWLILESRHRSRYSFGMAPPGVTPKSWFETGYMIKAESLSELAHKIGTPLDQLTATLDRFNAMAAAGVDQDFHRGETAIEHYYGDHRNKPNPNLGAIAEPPFYAVRIYPGDVGTAGGIVTDAHARALRDDGQPLPGLYAAGNITASVMGRRYPGAGASIGPALVFSYLAVRHMTTTTEDHR